MNQYCLERLPSAFYASLVLQIQFCYFCHAIVWQGKKYADMHCVVRREVVFLLYFLNTLIFGDVEENIFELSAACIFYHILYYRRTAAFLQEKFYVSRIVVYMCHIIPYIAVCASVCPLCNKWMKDWVQQRGAGFATVTSTCLSAQAAVLVLHFSNIEILSLYIFWIKSICLPFGIHSVLWE